MEQYTDAVFQLDGQDYINFNALAKALAKKHNATGVSGINHKGEIMVFTNKGVALHIATYSVSRTIVPNLVLLTLIHG